MQPRYNGKRRPKLARERNKVVDLSPGSKHRRTVSTAAATYYIKRLTPDGTRSAKHRYIFTFFHSAKIQHFL